MENAWCFPCVIAGAGYHKEGAGVLSTEVRAEQQQRVWGGSYPRLYSLCQRSRQTPSRAILFGCMEGLLGRREHLETFFGRHATLEDG